MCELKSFSKRHKKILIITTLVILSIYFINLRAWYRPMIFNTQVFDDFAKIVDECEGIDILYNKLNNPLVVEGVKYKYDLDFEDNKIYLDNTDSSGGFPLYFSYGLVPC